MRQIKTFFFIKPSVSNFSELFQGPYSVTFPPQGAGVSPYPPQGAGASPHPPQVAGASPYPPQGEGGSPYPPLSKEIN